MENIDFKHIVDRMKIHGLPSGEPISLHVPDAASVLRSAMKYFLGGELVWLPEYEQVAAWLDNNQGRGLCLYGNNGTGKTILVQKVIPLLLFRFCSRVVRCFNYHELNNHADNIINFRLLSIDDVGLENEGVIYGNKRWVFPEVMDMAEKRNNVVILSSNFDGKGFCEKYGIRTFERIVATTVRVEFKHQSLRK